jgi:hypothetical protein
MKYKINNQMKYKIIIIGFLTVLIYSCNTKRKSDLIANYEKNKSEIIEVKNYFNEIVPENFNVNIRFESADVINLEVYERPIDSLKSILLFRKWNIDFLDYKDEPDKGWDKKYHGQTNSLELVKNKLNWTSKTINELYQKLHSADCIGISNWEPTEIEYGYNGLGVYSYKIFDQNLDEKEIEKYNDGCNNIFYKDNVVLTYGGGAIGMQCFEGYQTN